jgi:uncharacterized phage infection (PIP) family protein YhgE
VKDWLKTVAALAVAALLCWVLWDAHLLLRDARAALDRADPALASLNAAAQQAAEAIAKFNSLANVESAKIQATTEELRKTERATRAGIDSLRQVFIDLHQRLLPQVEQTIAHADASQAQITAGALAILEELKPSLENLQNASAAAARDLADPAIPEALHHVDETSAHVAASTANLEGATADVKAVADKFREVYTKPGRNTWETVKALLHLIFETRGAIQK